MRLLSSFGAIVLFVAALAGCPGQLANPERFDIDAGTSEETTAACDAPALLVKQCATCHSGPSPFNGLHLDSPDAIKALVGKPATGGPGVLVKPGAPDESVLYLKLTTPPFGDRMPQTGPLGAADLACVKSWIEGLPPG